MAVETDTVPLVDDLPADDPVRGKFFEECGLISMTNGLIYYYLIRNLKGGHADGADQKQLGRAHHHQAAGVIDVVVVAVVNCGC